MNWGAVFAWTVATLQAGASIGYLAKGDWKRAVLWGCWSIGNVMVNIL